MEALHGGLSRTLFILQLFVKISLRVMIRQAILKIKHDVQHCFEEFKYSSSCISKCNSFYLIFWDGNMSFLTISFRASWFTCCQEWGILNPLISSFELSCVISSSSFHLIKFSFFFSQSAAQIISILFLLYLVLTGVSSKCFHFAKFNSILFISNRSVIVIDPYRSLYISFQPECLHVLLVHCSRHS